MPACEKCWTDAWGDPDEYRRLLKKRNPHPCTPEQQAGPEATECSACKRLTVHQYAGVCMVCARDERAEAARALIAPAHDTGERYPRGWHPDDEQR